MEADDEKKARRRPDMTTPETREEFLVRVACGDKFMTIFADPSMPTLRTVTEYLALAGPEPQAFRDAYYRAWRLRADGWAEENLEIVDNCPPAESGATRTPIPAQGGQQSGDCGQQVMAA